MNKKSLLLWIFLFTLALLAMKLQTPLLPQKKTQNSNPSSGVPMPKPPTVQNAFKPFSKEKQSCSPELKPGEKLRIWMPETLNYDSQGNVSIPLCMTLDLTGIKNWPSPKKEKSSNQMGKSYFAAFHWMYVWQHYADGAAMGLMNIPLDYPQGSWEADYPEPGKSYGDGDYQGIDYEYRAEEKPFPFELGKLNYYALDLASYDPDLIIWKMLTNSGQNPSEPSYELSIEFEGFASNKVKIITPKQ